MFRFDCTFSNFNCTKRVQLHTILRPALYYGITVTTAVAFGFTAVVWTTVFRMWCVRVMCLIQFWLSEHCTQKKKLEGFNDDYMAGQNTQWRDQETNKIEDIRTNHQAKKAEMVWTRVENGWWQDSETGYIMGNECNKPRTRKAEKELEQYHTPRFEEHRSGLGRCRTLHLR